MRKVIFEEVYNRLTEACEGLQIFSYEDLDKAFISSNRKEENVKALNILENLGLFRVTGFILSWEDEEYTKCNHFVDLKLTMDAAAPDGEAQLDDGIAKCIEWYKQPIDLSKLRK